jgi:hypothetical protein
MKKLLTTDTRPIEKPELLCPTAQTGAVQKLEPLLYTTADAQLLLGCGVTRLYELLASGKLRARRLGPRTMIEAQSLHDLVASLPLVVTPTRQRRTASQSDIAAA